MNEPATFRILIVDDSLSIHDDFRKVLSNPSTERRTMHDLANALFGRQNPLRNLPRFELDFAQQGQEGLALVAKAVAEGRPYAAGFIDMRMPPGWDGLETISRIWSVAPDMQMVICTAFSDHSWADITERLGHSDNLLILKKPFDHVEALQMAHALAKKWSLSLQQRAQVAELDRLVDLRTKEMRAAQQRFAEAFNASPLPQAILAHKPFAIVDVNRAFQTQFGLSLSEIQLLTPETFGRGINPTRLRTLLQRLADGEAIDDYAFLFQPDEKTRKHLRCSARATQINGRECSIWVLWDVSRLLETETQLRQAQKMEAVGQLAAGIAHDFNNLLTVIQGYTAELLHRSHDESVEAMLAPVQTAATQAATLTRQLLLFSRMEVLQRKQILPGEVLEALKPMLRRLISSDIQIDWDIAPALPPLFADPASIEQVIVNLVVNARDAMPNGGRISIRAAVRQLSAEEASHQVESCAGPALELSISDTGTGIAADILPKIFDPFFTTKEAGKGTGLGLATVYSIVKKHKGWIQVESQPGQGTRFILYYPLSTPRPEPEKTLSDALPPPSIMPALPKLLVVEDDQTLQHLLSSVLKNRKYAFDLAPDGVAALQLWKEKAGDYDVLITDIVMPNGINGIRLAQELRREKPQLPVLLMTGYSAALQDQSKPAIPGAPVQVLMKPFLPKDLFESISIAIRLARQSSSNDASS